jgi:hypothetical protein
VIWFEGMFYNELEIGAEIGAKIGVSIGFETGVVCGLGAKDCCVTTGVSICKAK